ncbi:hypothetical protein FG386_002392 [Cryptosporidium ryanae]|uniref:uncharacterized protein n=1 Tax=Cryptosporidium ryanae TaxID=515981 RepID=UPI00351A48C6|nr:hypothetical protein FG386_002392 [Cryptosporidium ryanae]
MAYKSKLKDQNGFILLTKSGIDGKVVMRLIVSLGNELMNFIQSHYNNRHEDKTNERIILTMNRKSEEIISSFNKRVSLNLKKQFEDFIKNLFDKNVSLQVSLTITKNGKSVGDISLKDLLESDQYFVGNLDFNLNKVSKTFCFEIIKNVNIIENVTLRNEMRLGFPVVPSLSFHKGTESDFSYKWYLQNHIPQNKMKLELLQTLPENIIEIDEGLVCGMNLENIKDSDNIKSITKNIEHYSLILRIVDNFLDSPIFDTIYRFNKINSPLKRSWRDLRVEYFKRDDNIGTENYKNRLRIVTFNILSEFFAQTEKALGEMYPNCPIYALQPNYRRSILAKELTDLEFDIICMQEVQLSLYNSFLKTLLENKGYKGVFHNEYGSVSTFYREDIFELLETKAFLFRDLLKENYTYLTEVIDVKWPDFTQKFLKNISTVYQITILRHINSGIIYIIGNTHLYYHKYGGHIRIIQVKLFMDLIDYFTSNIKHKYSNIDVIPFIMGDFNTLPFSDARMLLINGRISSKSIDWLHSQVHINEDLLACFENNTPEKLTNNGDFGLDIQIPNNCVDLFNINIDDKYDSITILAKDGEKRIKNDDSVSFDESLYYPFTNKVNGFSGQLDYIYLIEQDNIMEKYQIHINKYLSYINEDVLAPINTLPNPVYSSDHISVGIDITFRKKGENN